MALFPKDSDHKREGKIYTKLVGTMAVFLIAMGVLQLLGVIRL